MWGNKRSVRPKSGEPSLNGDILRKTQCRTFCRILISPDGAITRGAPEMTAVRMVKGQSWGLNTVFWITQYSA